MSTTTITNLDDVCAALRDVHDEASLWALSDEIAKVAPSGVTGVEIIVDEAKRRGIPTKSANTLRLYRDVAIRFPASERVGGVSFSAHREALGGYSGDVSLAKQTLIDLSTQHGAEGVTILTVKKAVAAATGKALPVGGAGAAKSKHQSGFAEVANDIATNGAKRFIGELDAIVTSGITLDQLHAGLSKLIAEVEVRRSKAARKAARPVKAAATPTGTPARHSKAAPTKARPAAKTNKVEGSKAGDLRGL